MMYHSARSVEEVPDAEPLYDWTDGKSHAFCHDLSMAGIPDRFALADVLYTEPSWRAGYSVFRSRVGGETAGDFREYVDSLGKLIGNLAIPAFVVCGRHMLKRLAPGDVTDIGLHGGGACLAIWNHRAIRFDDQDACILYLANKYQCVVDPSCGYGNAARTFYRNGKRFIASDLNPRCIRVLVDSLTNYAV